MPKAAGICRNPRAEDRGDAAARYAQVGVAVNVRAP